jgi:hypothetical protein
MLAFLLYNIIMARDKENIKRLQKEWYQKNKDLVKERARLWQLNNPEQKAKIRTKYRHANLIQHNKYNKLWWSSNKDKRASYQAKRKASQLQRTPKWLTKDDLWLIEEAYSLAQLRTNLFGIDWHVDHIIPLQGKLVSGLHVPSNIQVIPATENVKKSNKHLF